MAREGCLWPTAIKDLRPANSRVSQDGNGSSFSQALDDCGLGRDLKQRDPAKPLPACLPTETVRELKLLNLRVICFVAIEN